MPKPQESKIQSLTEFMKHVEAALKAARQACPDAPQKVTNWYRGCGNAKEYELVPTLYRHPQLTKPNELLVLERRMLEWFRRRSIVYKGLETEVAEAHENFAHLFFMQHYAVPTRLLDWTENPLIGLYFALTSAHYDPKLKGYAQDSCVWILNPTAWNEKSLGESSWGLKGAITITDNVANGYAPRANDEPTELKAMHEHPAAMYGIANNARMYAQKGTFTIFGRNTRSMEEAFEKDKYPSHCLSKLIIPKESIGSLLDDLLSIGFTDSVSYPDLQGLAMEIKRSFGFRV